ncbi:hypothetical protein C6A87_004630 [Mycobacterium sp. ITM-2016-00317]|uniref:hypothetical protein n=1 Tax=Mycobacterium sp. ITM-2016-00317 TaxID=2099694 RepID=UPI000D43C3BF|nr:hypothetical protein [Mycobacterium sp. ITM-2016-00317]WNG88531.1 hypothetical protein C6A87_004630 [Mycobacterium sp. ITM-2016-00317]
MHAELPGQVCEHGCGDYFGPQSLQIRQLPNELRTKVPIEGVGVIRITTTPIDCRAGFWETAVELARYADGTIREFTHMAGSATPAISAADMHTYWCDLETLTLCVQGVSYALHLIDFDYIERKEKELRLGDWADKDPEEPQSADQ